MTRTAGARSRKSTFTALLSAVVLVLPVLSACRSDQVSEYDVEGVVASVDEGRQVLEIVHGDIPGYMPAMQMPFPVEDLALLEGLGMGDEVEFRLTVTNGAAVVTSVDRLPPYSGPLPDFTLENLAGGTIDSADLAGRVTIINFWASWCAPCKVEMPILDEMTEDYPDTDFRVVGVAQDPENRAAISAVLADLGIGYTILLTDGEGTLESGVGGIPVIPATIVVNKNGQVVERRLGILDEPGLDDLRSLVESLL